MSPQTDLETIEVVGENVTNKEGNSSNANTEIINYDLGDHVYAWKSFMGVPFATQEHGIVVNVEPDWVTFVLVRKKETATEEENENTRAFCMVQERISLEEARKTWHKIPYGVKWFHRIFTRAGTANPVEQDDTLIVLSRVNFVWKYQSTLLLNLATESTNEKDISECIVVWCKTGNFYSYHGLAKLGHHGADVGSNATLAGGICTQLAASAVVPFLLPAFVVYDVATTVHSVKATHKCQKEWNDISRVWNEKFSIALQERQNKSTFPSLYSPPESSFPPFIE
jgi:hypothetical protein